MENPPCPCRKPNRLASEAESRPSSLAHNLTHGRAARSLDALRA
jgi:hypothetical protein